MANELDDFTPSRDFIKIFNEAKRIKNIDDMASIFSELAAEVGLNDDATNMSNASAGERLAKMLNAKQNNTSFEGSTPGKKV